jgi:anaerobic selenocysteine-containing dehydrogenase
MCCFARGWPIAIISTNSATTRQVLNHICKDRTPEWAEAICGVPAAEIEAFRAAGRHHQTDLFRLGYGFTRQRNGAVNMHAALSLAVVTGSFQYEGGGAFHSNSDIFRLDKSLLEGSRYFDPGLRWLDQSKIGRMLTGDAEALNGGPPVTAMLIQNTNPANVAPEQRKVIEGLRRDDLFVAVHEQFMTDTAQAGRCGAARHHVPRA